MSKQTEYLKKRKDDAQNQFLKSPYSTTNTTIESSFIHILVGINEYLKIKWGSEQDIDDSFFEYIIPNITDDTFSKITNNNVKNDNYIDGVIFLDNDNELVSGDNISEVSKVILYQSKSGNSGHSASDLKNLCQSIENLKINVSKIMMNSVLKKVVNIFKADLNVSFFPLYISLDSKPKIDSNVHSMVDPFVESLNTHEGFDFNFQDLVFSISDFSNYSPKSTDTSELRISELKEHLYGNSSVHTYTGFTHIYNYLNFINSEKKDFLEKFKLDEGLFLKNVRANIGNNGVNKGIYNTFLQGPSAFNGNIWWLSNGITIIAKDIEIKGDTIKLISPSIVNGQQTSRQLANAYSEHKEEFIKNNPSYSSWQFMIKIFIGDYSNSDVSNLIDNIIIGLNSQSAVTKNSVDLIYTETLELQSYLNEKGIQLEIRRGELSKNQDFLVRNDKKNILYIEELIQYATSAIFIKDDDNKSISIGKIRSSKSIIVNNYHKKLFKNNEISKDDLCTLAKSIKIFKNNLAFTEDEMKLGLGYLTFAIFRLIFMKYRNLNHYVLIDTNIYDEMSSKNIEDIKTELMAELKKNPTVNWDQESKKSTFQHILDSMYPQLEIEILLPHTRQ